MKIFVKYKKRNHFMCLLFFTYTPLFFLKKPASTAISVIFVYIASYKQSKKHPSALEYHQMRTIKSGIFCGVLNTKNFCSAPSFLRSILYSLNAFWFIFCAANTYMAYYIVCVQRTKSFKLFL